MFNKLILILKTPSKCCSLMKLNPFAFTIINIVICVHTFYDYLYFCQNALQTPTSNAGFTRRFTACTRRSHNAKKKTPKRCHSVPTERCLTRRANTIPRRLFWACSKQTPPHGFLGDRTARTQRAHNVADDCTTRTSAICILRTLWQRCKDATLV